MKPYTYVLRHIPSGMIYVGSRYGFDADPAGKKFSPQAPEHVAKRVEARRATLEKQKAQK